jgi:hypothetical protein
MQVFHTGNGRVSISQAAVSLLVGESVTISTGSASYSNIVLGSTTGDSNESFSVVNAGTIVDSANYILVGQNGSNNAMTVSGGASVADQAFTVVGLNATASTAERATACRSRRGPGSRVPGLESLSATTSDPPATPW